MTFNEYQKKVEEFDNGLDLYKLTGKAKEEFGELAAAMNSAPKNFGETVNSQVVPVLFIPKFKEEAGDVLFYICLIAKRIGKNLGEIVKTGELIFW